MNIYQIKNNIYSNEKQQIIITNKTKNNIKLKNDYSYDNIIKLILIKTNLKKNTFAEE
jgi:hypothetical protein